jgi:hypothetical protein
MASASFEGFGMFVSLLFLLALPLAGSVPVLVMIRGESAVIRYHLRHSVKYRQNVCL